ncbi:hypothetical protein HUU59_08465 [bacterium]|nr:hypothetical protein [bacterium]
MVFIMAAMMATMAVGGIIGLGQGDRHGVQSQTNVVSCCATTSDGHSEGHEQGEALLASADPVNTKSAHSDAPAEEKLAYPIDNCIVSGEKLGEMGEPVTKVYEGREVKFCCNMCPEKFEKDQANFMKKLDDAIIAKQKPGYPLETCIVSGEAFGGEMGDPVDFVYDNQYFKLCCKGCIKNIKKEPAKYLEKLSAAYESKRGMVPEESNQVKTEHQNGHEGHH